MNRVLGTLPCLPGQSRRLPSCRNLSFTTDALEWNALSAGANPIASIFSLPISFACASRSRNSPERIKHSDNRAASLAVSFVKYLSHNSSSHAGRTSGTAAYPCLDSTSSTATSSASNCLRRAPRRRIGGKPAVPSQSRTDISSIHGVRHASSPRVPWRSCVL